MKKYFIISACLLSVFLCTGAAFAQTLTRDSIQVPVRVKRPLPVKNELSGGLRLNTDGWSLFLDRGKVKSTDKTTDYYYNLEAYIQKRVWMF